MRSFGAQIPDLVVEEYVTLIMKSSIKDGANPYLFATTAAYEPLFPCVRATGQPGVVSPVEMASAVW